MSSAQPESTKRNLIDLVWTNSFEMKKRVERAFEECTTWWGYISFLLDILAVVYTKIIIIKIWMCSVKGQLPLNLNVYKILFFYVLYRYDIWNMCNVLDIFLVRYYLLLSNPVA